MKEIIFYTTGCPACKLLKRRLDEKKLSYVTITDEEVMREKGFTHIPMLEIDGVMFTFSEALKEIIKL